jgi:hypothetical protein
MGIFFKEVAVLSASFDNVIPNFLVIISLPLMGQSHKKVCAVMIWNVNFGVQYTKVYPPFFKF